jgi:hypothetical protein
VADLIPACDPVTLGKDAKKYLPNRDPGFDLISTLKGDYQKSGVGAATTADGFAVLARLAFVRDNNLQIGTATDGGLVADETLGCMSVPGGVPTSFAAVSSLDGGIFEVKPTGAVVALGNLNNASVKWGAEPGSNGWPAGTYLVYGYQTGTNPFSFELGTIPAGVVTAASQAANPLSVGVCSSSVVVDQTGKATAANLLVHSGSEILSLVRLGFCHTSVMSPNTSPSWLALVRSHVASFFSPTTLFAQDDSRDFIGGLPSGWSPFEVDGFTASNVTLTFSQQPGNTTTSSPPVTVKVTATPATNTTLPPLNIRLTIAGNNGTPAFFAVNGGTAGLIDAPAVPNGDGTATATFTYGYTKAGGYTLTAAGFIGGGGVKTPAVISSLFQVQNK